MSNEEKTTIDKNGLLIFTTLIAMVASVFSPLIAWFTIKNTLEQQQKDYLTDLFNFEITMFIVGLIVSVILKQLLGLIALVNIVILIIAAIKCGKKETFKFPLTITLIK
jgi:uncharacterized Tic20 family protein